MQLNFRRGLWPDIGELGADGEAKNDPHKTNKDNEEKAKEEVEEDRDKELKKYIEEEVLTEVEKDAKEEPANHMKGRRRVQRSKGC